MKEYKVLSVNPGAEDRLPSFSREQVKAPQSISPLASSLSKWFGISGSRFIHGSVSLLLLRIVAGAAIIGSAIMQMRGTLNVFGFEEAPFGWGVTALVSGCMVILGILGRFASFGIAALCMMSLVSYAYDNGGVADFTAANQLSLIYGDLAAMVAVLGTGRFTVQRWAAAQLLRSL